MTREQAFRFGRAQHLVGIAGIPDNSPAAVGVIVLNAGLVHRIGPFRLHYSLHYANFITQLATILYLSPRNF